MDIRLLDCVLVDADMLASPVINIVFEGLDTVAEVYINDLLVGRSDSQFVRYVFSIHSSLVVCFSFSKRFLRSSNFITLGRVFVCRTYLEIVPIKNDLTVVYGIPSNF